MKSSSAVARQYCQTAYATSALMWCSCSPVKIETTRPSGATTARGVVSAPLSADSQA
jgi:hypothetical protein